MSFDFKILGSSSSGNSALIKTKSTRILIDVGFSAKKIKTMLEQIGESIDNIDAICITHEHTDHVAGLQGLSAYPHLKVFTNAATADYLQSKIKRKINWQIFQTGQVFDFQDFRIHTLSTPHDAYDPVAYIFHNTQASANSLYKKLAWVTDLGYVPENIKNRLQDVDILVLESNYDPDLLEKDTLRPFPIKQRIKSRHGHLSNQDAFELLSSLSESDCKQVYLAHLSPHCNNKLLVEALFMPLRNRYQINIIDPLGEPLTQPFLVSQSN